MDDLEKFDEALCRTMNEWSEETDEDNTMDAAVRHIVWAFALKLSGTIRQVQAEASSKTKKEKPK